MIHNSMFIFEKKWVPRGGVDLALAFLSEGPRFEPCPRQLWKKLFQDESLDSHTRKWDGNACIIGAWHNSLDRSPPRYLVSPMLKVFKYVSFLQILSIFLHSGFMQMFEKQILLFHTPTSTQDKAWELPRKLFYVHINFVDVKSVNL